MMASLQVSQIVFSDSASTQTEELQALRQHRQNRLESVFRSISAEVETTQVRKVGEHVRKGDACVVTCDNVKAVKAHVERLQVGEFDEFRLKKRQALRRDGVHVNAERSHELQTQP